MSSHSTSITPPVATPRRRRHGLLRAGALAGLLACAAAAPAAHTGPAATFNPNQSGLSGSWANAATDGQGFLFDVVADFYGSGRALIFGGWFTYDVAAPGGLRWYTVQGELAREGVSSMAIYQTLGGSFDSGQATSTAPVGEFRIQFSNCTRASSSYRFNDGRTGEIPLTRLLANFSCVDGTATAPPPESSAWSGAWADPANAGQGLVLEFSPAQQIMFGAWYTFAPNAGPAAGVAAQDWYTVQAAAPRDAASLTDIGIYATRGGLFDRHATTSTDRVGTVTLAMRDCTLARLDYAFTAGPLAGRTGTLDLLRVTPPRPECVVPAPQTRGAEGYWKGSSQGRDFRIIVPGDGTYYIVFQRNGVDQGVVYGTLTDVDGRFASADGTEFAINIGALDDAITRRVGVEGSFVPGESMQLRLTHTDGLEVLSASWDPVYDKPARIDELAGAYLGYAAVTVTGLGIDFSIDATGELSGSIGAGACRVSATLRPRGATNLFDMALRGRSPRCVFGAGPLPGLAWYDPATRSFHGYTPFAGRSRVQYMLGSRLAGAQAQ